MQADEHCQHLVCKLQAYQCLTSIRATPFQMTSPTVKSASKVCPTSCLTCLNGAHITAPDALQRSQVPSSSAGPGQTWSNMVHATPAPHPICLLPPCLQFCFALSRPGCAPEAQSAQGGCPACCDASMVAFQLLLNRWVTFNMHTCPHTLFLEAPWHLKKIPIAAAPTSPFIEPSMATHRNTLANRQLILSMTLQPTPHLQCLRERSHDPDHRQLKHHG